MGGELLDRFTKPTRRLGRLDLLGKRDWDAARTAAEMGISKASLSEHIALLKGTTIVHVRREGKTVYFSLPIPEVKSACHAPGVRPKLQPASSFRSSGIWVQIIGNHMI